MPLEIIAALASTVVSSILMPYVKDGAAKMAERISEKAGSATGQYTVQLAEKVWNKVKSAFSSEEEKTTLASFERRPEAATPLVEDMLKEKLQKDDQLMKELEALVKEKSPNGQTGAQIIGATYAGILDMRGAVVSGGVFAGLNIGQPVQPPTGTPVPSPSAGPAGKTPKND